MSGNLSFEGAFHSVPKQQTPQYVRQHGMGDSRNRDFAACNAAGLFVADGVGSLDGSAAASWIAVTESTERAEVLNINQMPMDEAIDAIRTDVLPHTDRQIARFRDAHGLEQTSTTFSALFMVRNALAAVVIGNSPIYRLRQSSAATGSTVDMTRIGWDQELPEGLTNSLAGIGRMVPGMYALDTITNKMLPPHLVEDLVLGVEIEPGDRYVIVTDGVSGNSPDPESCLPWSIMQRIIVGADTPLQAAMGLIAAPDLYQQALGTVQMPDSTIGHYKIHNDDMTAGTLFVGSPS